VVDGSITNSQSLNKYSYVQGNPVNLSDPFGLFPIDGETVKQILSIVGHSVLDVVGVFWDGADLINAYWYYKEGNEMMAMTYAVAAIPFVGSFVADSLKFAFVGSKYMAKAAKAAKYIEVGSKLVGYTAQATMGYVNTGYAAADVIAGVRNGTVTSEELLNLGANAFSTLLFTGAAIGSASTMTRMLKADGVGDSVRRIARESWLGNGGAAGKSSNLSGGFLELNLQFFAKSGSDISGGVGTSKGGSDLGNKRLYRVMSEGELSAVKETGLLRGGREQPHPADLSGRRDRALQLR